MKKMLFIIALTACFGLLQAQDAQTCPCLMDNDIEALYAVAEQQDFSLEADVTIDPITAAAAIAKVGLEVYKAAPEASYYLKVTSGGEIAYAKISSCQLALEKTYDLLRLGVEEVRIISENPTLNGSCRNRSYTPRDLDEVKKRRDGWSGGR